MSDNNSKLELKNKLEVDKEQKNDHKDESNIPTGADINQFREDLGSLSEGLTGSETVSESANENPSENAASQHSSNSTSTTGDQKAIQKLQVGLKESTPKKEKMIKEIKKVLKKEEKALNKEIHSYMKTKAYDALNSAVAKLRQIYLMLEELAYATYESIKGMWLKIVHKVN
ncbi:MAG: hypothetical protein UR28_C0011G0015 [Candidatus Peregrinibacteria bacterium GW2011_GWF2_33_10]|nr:MAG: hypothetical protein UR28_C0011G0015 [Candidatus Peregrinibacteria bacterium GW2011_GWF2_33_10]OGJ44292.1 MAG: hypothetical protein A2272_05535 [Candidatus Peregrinibacteria bacterium RIFOXYA12_FULL_33_12]OGJ44667.1 MAG: hypothetical protein A2263_00975 [Candidatus Peregrinibacteria bacterium RIFOXYA2_FULL_33_21]OGJ50401.1 MAG: hypothetical protein A2307_06035 [Candidatus Peregrinibacteria bacterium RIFOXYB2_FULL_33_20]